MAGFDPEGQIRTQADRLLAALNQNHALLFLVLAGLHEARHKVAGPWLRETSTQRNRHDPTGRKLALVKKDRDRTASLSWRASLSKHVGEAPDGSRFDRGFPTEFDALLWCDQTLIEHGFVLTTDPGSV